MSLETFKSLFEYVLDNNPDQDTIDRACCSVFTIEAYDYIKHKYKFNHHNLLGSCMEQNNIELCKHIIMNGLYNSEELHKVLFQFEQIYPDMRNPTYMYLKSINECDV